MDFYEHKVSVKKAPKNAQVRLFSSDILSCLCTDARLVPAVDLPVCSAIPALFRVAVLCDLRGPLDEGRDANRALFRYTGAWSKLYTVLGEHRRRRWLLVLLRDTFDHRLVCRSGLGVRIQGEC